MTLLKTLMRVASNSDCTMTANKAAAETRHNILREMTRLEAKTRLKGVAYEAIWQQLRIFIDGMAIRASKKPGGLGRR